MHRYVQFPHFKLELPLLIDTYLVNFNLCAQLL